MCGLQYKIVSDCEVQIENSVTKVRLLGLTRDVCANL